jgi:hypothetical protein
MTAFTADGRAKALEYFHQAIAKDPGFAGAYVGLAGTQILRGFFGESADPQEMSEGMAAARKALSLGSTFALQLPTIPAGKYKVFADIVRAPGSPKPWSAR